MPGSPDDPFLALLRAIDEGDLPGNGRLVDQGAPLAAPGGRTTALHHAIDFGSPEAMAPTCAPCAGPTG